MARKTSRRELRELFIKQEHFGFCYYCGNAAANHYNEFIPISYLSTYPIEKLKQAELLLLIPSCIECEIISSSTIPFIFKTIALKRQAIQKHLKSRYAGVLLNKPEYELSPRDKLNKAHLLARLAWTNAEVENETIDHSLQKGQKYCINCNSLFWPKTGVEQFCSKECADLVQAEQSRINLQKMQTRSNFGTGKVLKRYDAK
jgi:predicted nucleic acid-binding Zn ribbon protein